MPGKKKRTGPPATPEGGSGPHGRPRKVRTLWHPLACTLIDASLPEGYHCYPEYQLHHEPQRVDLLVLLREEQTPGEIDQLPSLMSRLGAVTLLEYKGVTDELDAFDASVVNGYASQLLVQRGLAPRELTLGVVAVRMTPRFRERVEAHGGTLAQVEPGVWEGQLSGSPLFMLETSQVWQRSEGDRLLYVLTPEFLVMPERIHPMTEKQEILYNQLYERLEQIKPEGAMALKNYEELRENWRKAKREMLESLPVEERLKGIPPEEIVRVLKPEERLQGLKPEERLQGLKPEERLQGLKPEERLQGLKPEEIAQALSPEELERLKALLH